MIRQPPIGEKDDYDSENSWISRGLPSNSRRRRRGDGRGELGSGERSEVQARLTLTSTAPTVRSSLREVATLDEAPRISQRASSTIRCGIVIIDMGHHSAITDIGMPVHSGGIRAYISFLVDAVKARGGTFFCLFLFLNPYNYRERTQMEVQ